MKKLVILLLTLVLAAGCAFTVYSLAKSGGSGSGSGTTIEQPDKSDENNGNTDDSDETPSGETTDDTKQDDTKQDETPAEDPAEEKTYTVVDLTARGSIVSIRVYRSKEYNRRISRPNLRPKSSLWDLATRV